MDTASGQDVSWRIGTLAPGQTVTANIITRVNLDVALPFVIENLAALEPPYIGTSRARVISITALPQTGESPWWRDLALFLITAAGSFAVVDLGLRRLPRQSR
ncbi:hypothetical protein HC928_22245 [bacterium]|nr:hypothetical protein [bacterium]